MQTSSRSGLKLLRPLVWVPGRCGGGDRISNFFLSFVRFPPPQPGPVCFFSQCKGTLASNLRMKASLLVLPTQQFYHLVAQWRSVLKASGRLGKHSLGKLGRPQPFQHLKFFHLAIEPTMPTISIRLGRHGGPLGPGQRRRAGWSQTAVSFGLLPSSFLLPSLSCLNACLRLLIAFCV